MIVTTGKIIKIKSGQYDFASSSESPGIVTVQHTHGEHVTLPTNAQEMEEFIKAYRRTCAEELGYRKMENE